MELGFGCLVKNVEVLYLDKKVRNMSGFGIWVVLPKNVEVLYLDKKSPQYEWSWDLGGLAKKCRGIIPRQKKSAI